VSGATTVQQKARRQHPAGRPRPRVPIDPRIRDRRIAVARAQGRRRLRILLSLVGLLGLLTAAVAVVFSPLLDVDKVVVTGEFHTSAGSIRAAAGLRKGDPILTANLGAAERATERLPWILHARAERDLPGTVRITVTERIPVGWARRTAESVALLDGDGRVLGDAAAPPGGLPELVGGPPVPAPGHRVARAGALRIAAAIPPELALQIAAVQVVQGRGVARLTDGGEIRLGDLTHLGAKFAAARAVLAAVGHPVAYVDVQVPSVPVTG